MSKKHKKHAAGQAASSQVAYSSDHAGEYRIIQWDLIRLAIFNVVMLGAVLVLYYTNNKTHYLETWFSRIFHL